jgi:hypothetical protein
MTRKKRATFPLHSTLTGLIFLFFTLQLYGGAGDGDASTTKTNLEIFQMQLSSMAREAVHEGSLGGDRSLRLNFRNPDSGWLAQNTILEALKEMGYNLFIGSSDSQRSSTLDVGLLEMKVSYGPAFRDTFLGKRKTPRTVKTSLSANLRAPNDEILFAGILSRSFTDTVRASDIHDLENPAQRITQGEAPADGFFDNVIEPLVIIGASAVAVYLFFTVRS